MCIICVDFQKQKLTISEAWAVLGEMVLDKKHNAEVEKMLDEAGRLTE